jgi:hypothetical protein
MKLPYLVVLEKHLPQSPYTTVRLIGGVFESGHLHREPDDERLFYLVPKNGRKRHYFLAEQVLQVTVVLGEDK